VTIAAIGNPSFISLRTFRKSGVAVDTPVWVAADDGKLYVYTATTAGKAKRIRNSGAVEVCASDMRGKPKGEWVSAHARVLDGAVDVAHGLALLKRKYGIQYRLVTLFDRGRTETVILEISDRV
jgi:PPOX class probable F420-dependent enzyme